MFYNTNDPTRRLEEHNNVNKNSFTSKVRPWIMKACFERSESRGLARKVENYIKRMKSRKLIENLIRNQVEKPGSLTTFVRSD